MRNNCSLYSVRRKKCQHGRRKDAPTVTAELRNPARTLLRSMLRLG